MEFCTLGLVAVVVVILILFVCSITSFVNQLPKCQKATRRAFEGIVVRMGSFINFKRNTKILSDRINELTMCIQELEESNKSEEFTLEVMIHTQKEAMEVSNEAGQIINNSCWWGRRSCYQLSNRVATMILKIEDILNPQARRVHQPKEDGIPGISVVFLIAYSLTNAVLHLIPNSTTTGYAYVIDWIVVDMVYSFKLKNNLKLLRERMNVMKKTLYSFKPSPELKHLQFTIRHQVGLVEEAQLVIDEVELYMMINNNNNYWYKGWTIGSRCRLGKKVEKCLKNLIKNCIPFRGGGNNMRRIIYSIDKMSHTLPATITDIRHYLHLKTHIELLNELIIVCPAQRRLGAAASKKLEKEVRLLEAAQAEGMKLIQQAQSYMDQHCWYKMWPASRYKLSKRLANMTIYITKLGDDLESKSSVITSIHTGYQKGGSRTGSLGATEPIKPSISNINIF